MNATCAHCQRRMDPGVGCSVRVYADFADGIARERIEASSPCHDCNAPARALHHPGCDTERCPKCSGQAIGCGCAEGGEE